MPIILILSLFLLTSCNADKLNRHAAKFNKRALETVDSIVNLDFEKLTKSKSSTKELNNLGRQGRTRQGKSNSGALDNLSLEAFGIPELENSIKEVSRTYKDAKSSIVDTKKKYDETKANLRSNARKIAGRLPRSEAEANQLVNSYTRDFVEYIRANFKSANFKNSSVPRTSRKNNEGRKR